MTQLTNDYIFEVLANQGYSNGEDIFLFAAGTVQQAAGAGTTPKLAYPVKGQLHRIVANALANTALVMKSILTSDNPQFVVLINDSPNTVVVFPFLAFGAGALDTGELINGVATGFAIPTLTTAVFFSSLVQLKRKGGTGSITPALNWSANTFS